MWQSRRRKIAIKTLLCILLKSFGKIKRVDAKCNWLLSAIKYNVWLVFFFLFFFELNLFVLICDFFVCDTNLKASFSFIKFTKKLLCNFEYSCRFFLNQHSITFTNLLLNNLCFSCVYYFMAINILMEESNKKNWKIYV